MNFKLWLFESEHFVLPNPVTVFGKRVDTTVDMDKLFKNFSPEPKNHWTPHLHPNAFDIDKLLMAKFQQKFQRLLFWNAIANDPVAQNIAKPLFDSPSKKYLDYVINQLESLGISFAPENLDQEADVKTNPA